MIMDVPTPETLSTMFPNAVRTTVIGGASFDTKFVTLIPANVTRGVVTLERVRGNVGVYFDALELGDAMVNWSVMMQLQLVMARNGAITSPAVLSPMNTADQESNKIIWQRRYYPVSSTSITRAGDREVISSNYRYQEVDIKVKRRFDRATWALAFVVEAEATALTLHMGYSSLRALFRSADGI